MAELFKVSQSKIKDYRQCQQRYFFKHCLKIERLIKARPLKFGDIVHKMKEAMARGDDAIKVILDKMPIMEKRLFEREREMYGEILTDIRYIFSAYLDYWNKEKKEPLIFVARKDQLTEHPFEIDYGRDILIKGKIDAITSKRKMLWLTEHKNFGKIPNDDERWRDIQSVVYIRIIEMLGWWKDIQGTCWDYIRTKPPTRPQLLKSGEMSERSIDTLPNVVLDVLKQHKKKPADYKELVDAARRNVPTYFQRVYTPTKKKPLETIFRDFIATAIQMRDQNIEKTHPKTIGRHCSWCEFEPLCRAEMQGLDTDFIREKHYGASTYEAESGEEE